GSGCFAVSIRPAGRCARSSQHVWGRSLRAAQRRLLADVVWDVAAGSKVATCALTEGALVPPFAARMRKPIRSTGVEPVSSEEKYRFKRAEAIREVHREGDFSRCAGLMQDAPSRLRN